MANLLCKILIVVIVFKLGGIFVYTVKTGNGISILYRDF